jgi:hypothetical protein
MARRSFSAKLDANMVCKIPDVCRLVELQRQSSRLSNLEGEAMHATFKVSGAACLVGPGRARLRVGRGSVRAAAPSEPRQAAVNHDSVDIEGIAQSFSSSNGDPNF